MTQAMRFPRSRRTRLVAASSAAVIVWSLAAAAQAQDLPTNPVIVDSSGGVGTAADFTFGSNLLTIDQNHDRVVIDWDDFNIGALDTVTFNQPDAGAIAFNRVDPTTFTTIDGTLNANGGVWLFSPGGLLFGSGAVVNVGSFVGTTARLADVDIADALATNAVTLRPIPIPNGADLTVSAGADITATSGFVVLLGETIVQDGVIVSDNDAVWFGVALGGEITFTSPGAGQAPDLADGTVAAVAGQQPAFTQGNTGSTTAATWVGVSNPSTTANGWSTLINLGGTIEASGIKPSTDAGVFIITGDDGVYDLTTAGTFVDGTGLITANNGDVYIRSGGAVTLQDVYAEDIDIFTGEDLTLTGAIQATGDIVIGSDTLVTIESTADLDAAIDVIITTTSTGADIVVDGTIYAYQYVTLVADDLLEVNGTVEGVYGVDLWGIDVTTTAGSLVTSLNDIYINAEDAIDLSGDISGHNVTAVSDVDIIQRAGTITVESRFDAYAGGEFNTSAGALITSAVGYDAIVDVIANGDISLAGDVTAYDVIFAGHGDMIEVSGLLSGSERVSIYNDSGDIHLTSTAEIYAGPPVYETYPVVYIGASGSIVTDAGSYIHTAPGYPGAYVNMHSNGPTGTFDLSGDITSANIYIGSRNGDVDVILRDGDLVATEYVFVVSSGDLTTGANTTITTDGNVYLDADANIDLSGDISGHYVSVVADGNIHQLGGTITVENGGFYSYSAYDTTTDAGAVITNAVGSDNAVIEIFAGYSLDLGGAIYGYEVFLDSVGPMIMISGSIYASDFIFVYNDTGSLHLTGTADLEAGTPVSSAFSSIYLGAYGSMRVDAGAQITAGVGQPGAYVSLYANGPTGYLNMSGDIASGGIYMGARSGDVDVYIGGTLDADEDIYIGATGDLTTGAASSITAGDYVWVSGDASVHLSGDIYAYQVAIYSDGDVTQAAGTITVDDGGLYVYAFNDIITEAGALIEASPGGANAIIYLNAAYDLYLAGDIDGAFFVTINSVGTNYDTVLEVSGSIYATDWIILYNDYGDIHLTSTADLYVGTPTVFSAPSIYIAAEGSIDIDAGAQLATRAGFSGSYIGIYSNDVVGTIDVAGDLTTENVYIYSNFGDIDVTISGGTIDASGGVSIIGSGDVGVADGAVIYSGLDISLSADVDVYMGGVLDADGDIFVVANGDLTTGVNSSITAGDYVYLFSQTSIDLGGDIYAYQVQIISDGDVTQSAGTITVDDGGLYVYALYDVTTEAGALIETTIDGGNAIIYLNAGDDLTVGGDIDGGFFVNLNSEANDYDSLVTISGSIYSTDFIIVYNQYGDIHLTGTAELFAGQPTVFGEPGIWIEAEGSILSDAGSYIHTYPGYASGYVHIESNAVAGSIDLSSDITTENLTIEAPFGVVDIYLRGGTIQTQNDFYLDSNGQLLLGANLYANYVTLESVGDLTVSGDIVANNGVSLTSTGGDVYISGFVEGYADAGTAILVSAAGDLTITATGDLEGYGDVVLEANDPTGLLEVSGDVLGYNVYLDAQGGILVGATADIYAYDLLQLLSQGPGGTVADIQIDGIMDGNGVSIINRNIGDVTFGSTAQVQSYYYYCDSCRTDPDGQIALQGMDGDIYIYSTGSVVTAAGSLIDASLGYGADAGLLTIIANGTDGATAAIDLAGAIVADDTVLTAANGSIAVRTGGAIEYGNFTADAGQDFILESGASIEAFAAADLITITAGDDIQIDGLIDGSRVYVTATGAANDPAGTVIDISGTVTADYYVGIENQDGDIFIRSGAYVGGAYYSGYTVVIDAYGDLTTEAGSYIYGGNVRLLATAEYGDLTTAGDIYGYEVYLFADTDMDIGGTIGGEFIDIVAQGGDSAAGDITISAEITSASGISIRNYNDGTVTFTADAAITLPDGGYYCYTCLQGNDGDIYIYSAGAVVTAAGSLIDATGGVGADVGLVTIVANGTDGATSAIDLSGDIVSYVTDLQADFGSIRQRDGTIYVTDGFNAEAAESFIQDSAGVIDGVNGVDDSDIDIYAGGDIRLGGVIEGYYVDITTTGSALDSDIEIDGEVYATDGIEIINQNGDILVDSTGVIHTGTPYETSNPYIDLIANGVITTEAGSQIYTDPAYSSTSQITLQSTLASGLGIDLAGDIATAGYVDILATVDADIQISGGTIQAGRDVYIDGQNQIDITGGMIEAGDTVLVRGDGDVLLGGDIYADFIAAYGGPTLRVEGAMTALTDILINGQAVEIGAGAQVTGNYSGLPEGGSASVHISGASIVTEAGSLITVGGGGTPVGQVVLQVASNFAGPGPAIDLSGDITAEDLSIALNANNDFRMRDGDITVINSLFAYAYGYFIVDEPASMSSEGDIVFGSGGAMIIDGDLTGDRIYLAGWAPNGLVVNGGLFARENIYLIGGFSDVLIGEYAILEADTDGTTGIGENNGISITAGDQVIAAPGARLYVGPAGAPTGDVTITANGLDSGGYSAIDLGADIDAADLILSAPNGSIRLRDGDIVLTDDLNITSSQAFVMDGPATIVTDGYVDITAVGVLTVAGTIDSGGDISLASTGLPGGPVTVNGYLYADGAIDISLSDPGATVILGGPTLIADADNSGGDGSVSIFSAGTVLAPGGGLIQVGDGSGQPTGDVSITANGFDWPSPQPSAIDLNIDINAQTLTLDAPNGSIHLVGGDIYVTDDLAIDSAVNFVMEQPATITGLADVAISATGDLYAGGTITAGGDVSLYLGNPLGNTYFTAGPGDLVVSGDVTANGSVTIASGDGGDDIYLDPTAAVLANADDIGTGDEVYISAYGQVISAAGSTIAVGTTPSTSGDVTILAGGTDNASYSAIDLAGDIDARSLQLQTAYGSIHLADGTIEVAYDLTLDSNFDIVMDYAAAIYGQSDVGFIADRDLVVNGQVYAQGGVSLLVTAGGDQLTVDGLISAGGDIDIVNLGADVVLGSQATLFSNGDILLQAYGDLTTDGFIDSAGLLTADAGGAMTFDADVQAGAGVILLAGDDMAIGGYLIAEGYSDIFAEAGGSVTLTGTGHLLGGDDVRLYAGGDLVLDGRVDNLGLLYGASAGDIAVSGVVQAGQVDLYAAGAIDLSGDLTAANGDLVAQAGQGMDVSGDLAALADIDLRAGAGMGIDGQVIALDDVYLTVQGSGDILIGGDVIAQGDVRIDNSAGDVRLYDGADLVADVNGDGGDDALLSIYAEGRIYADAGSNMHVGSAVERTGLILLGSYAYDGEGGAAIQLAGDIDAQAVEIWADYGSVHVQDGSIQADESIEIYAYEDFIHDDGALIWGAQDRVFQDDLSTEATLPGLVLPGVLITASDVDISGDIQSGTATDDATIVIAALNVDGDVTLGGADNGLATGFTLSDAEFQNLIADRIVLLAGTGPGAPDLIVSDLSIDAANTSDVWLGTTGTVFVEGAVTPTQPGEVDLHIGFTVLTQGINVIDLTALSPGQILVDFIPTDVHISGSLGSVSNPFGHVTLIANGDILMGSSAFMAAAENDPEFDAFEESENYESPGEGHVFIAADLLQMAATGEILQQDTVDGPGFGGLVLGPPQEGYELIFSPDDIEGQPIGFGQDQWTANFNAGPTRIELFGQFNGTPHAITGVEAARLDHLLDPDILLGDYEFNTCLFGGTPCQIGNDVSIFQNPTPPVHPDPAIDPGVLPVEEWASFFTTFPFEEPDEEEEEERIEGEPVTGSGNEDLWPVTTQGGTRP